MAQNNENSLYKYGSRNASLTNYNHLKMFDRSRIVELKLQKYFLVARLTHSMMLSP
jgi:hypothetical protein